MTPEDLQQIRAIVHEEIAASEQRMTVRQDRTVESMTANLSDLRTELFSRLDRIERRCERTELNVSALLMQTAGMSKSLSQAEQIDSSLTATQAAQQRAIDDLYRQIAEIRRQQQGQ